jgi:hypothetical protein
MGLANLSEVSERIGGGVCLPHAPYAVDVEALGSAIVDAVRDAEDAGGHALGRGVAEGLEVVWVPAGEGRIG